MFDLYEKVLEILATSFLPYPFSMESAIGIALHAILSSCFANSLLTELIKAVAIYGVFPLEVLIISDFSEKL